MRKPAELERVLRLVERCPGRSSLELAWMTAGGAVGPQGALGSITLDPATLLRVMGVYKRLADLVRRGDVSMRPPVSTALTGGLGYYAVAPRPGARAPDPQPEGGQTPGGERLRALRAFLGGGEGG
jgi:hypothetical protein